MRYLLRRAGFYLIALWAAVSFNFIIPRLMPGDPAEAYIARLQTQQVTRAQIEAIRAEFGVNPNTPIWKQYVEYLNGLLHGNLGISTSQFPSQVVDILRQSLPWTIGLVGASLVLSFFLGTLIGILIAWKRGSWYDTAVPPVLTFLSSVPYFWMALGLVYLFGVNLNWFPTDSGYDVFNVSPGWSMDFISSVVQHAVLPVTTLVIGSLAGWVLIMRNMMITTLSEDYVLMAQAKGLPERHVMFGYAARNAILPSITSFSIALGLIVSGALLTEIVFNYPGIGFALYKGVQSNDYALVEGCFLVIALAVLFANFLFELLYTLLDPRVRQGKK
jgi:peptide/nickel transport system permease protein